MRPIKTLGAAAALVAAALVGGTLISSALATDENDGEADGRATERGTLHGYCDTYLDALAGELGTDVEALETAARAAADATIEAAVANGDLTDAQAGRITEWLDAAGLPGCGSLGLHLGQAHRHGLADGASGRVPLEAMPFGGGKLGGWASLDAAGAALGLDLAELRESLADGSSLAEIAEAAGIELDAIVERITDAIEDGSWPGRGSGHPGFERGEHPGWRGPMGDEG